MSTDENHSAGDEATETAIRKGTLMKSLSMRALATLAVVACAACVSSNRARSVRPSAFLGESASLLKKGTKKEALLVYKKQNADWASYDKVLLEPVTIWQGENSTLSPDAMADYQKLVNNFYLTLKDKLSKDYRITDVPEEGAMRIQTALIDGAPANATLKVAKTVAPFAGYADTLWAFATGKPWFAGEVSIEYLIKDSRSGELLAAGADRRVGGTQLGKATLNNWGDVQNILEYWSTDAVYRLCVYRGAKNCRRAKAGLVKNPLR